LLPLLTTAAFAAGVQRTAKAFRRASRYAVWNSVTFIQQRIGADAHRLVAGALTTGEGNRTRLRGRRRCHRAHDAEDVRSRVRSAIASRSHWLTALMMVITRRPAPRRR
jgi:hypothetical protein